MCKKRGLLILKGPLSFLLFDSINFNVITWSVTDEKGPLWVGIAVILVGRKAGKALPTRSSGEIAHSSAASEDIVVRLNNLFIKGVGSETVTNKKLTDTVVIRPDSEILRIREVVEVLGSLIATITPGILYHGAFGEENIGVVEIKGQGLKERNERKSGEDAKEE